MNKEPGPRCSVFSGASSISSRFPISQRLAVAGQSVPWSHRPEIGHPEVSHENNEIKWLEVLVSNCLQ